MTGVCPRVLSTGLGANVHVQARVSRPEPNSTLRSFLSRTRCIAGCWVRMNQSLPLLTKIRLQAAYALWQAANTSESTARMYVELKERTSVVMGTCSTKIQHHNTHDDTRPARTATAPGSFWNGSPTQLHHLSHSLTSKYPP